MQQSMALKEHEAEKLRELDAMKTRFFANVTHEFRTPLTLILSPTKQMLGENLEARFRHRIATIERNARQLLQLINQLMDFSKLEANMMTVNESRGNLNNCIEQWLQAFYDKAANSGIRINFESQFHGDCWFDAAKLEQIVTNLVSNALKFTPSGGQIRVELQLANTESTEFVIKVTDTGIGIPADKVTLIFNRYYQIDHPSAQMPGQNAQPGTGIGLALVKELVDCQKGTIQVNSQEGKGSVFTVRLPCRPVLSIETRPETSPLTPEIDGKKTEEVADEAVLILLVEDNLELAEFIAESLPKQYRVQHVLNGVEGLQQSIDRMPDLIISDVMMPLMDGYSLCRNLKADLRTCRIPVILLTAKSSYDSRIEGLSLGAEDYITKQFHVQELQLRVRNLLDSKRRLRDRILVDLNRPGPLTTPEPADKTDPFLQRITSLLESNLDNSAFGVEDLLALTQMSRMSLYRKLKTLTGMSTGDFIRLYRLKRSTQFLNDGHSVAETAYLVGFETPSHFSKIFREHYQVSPSQFATPARLINREVFHFSNQNLYIRFMKPINPNHRNVHLSRRQTLRLLTASGATLATGGLSGFLAPAPPSMLTRLIPSSKEKLPVVGIGTWQTFDVSGTAEQEPLLQALKAVQKAGGKMIDSSPMYGHSEEVVGKLTADSGIQNQFFYATKVWTRGREAGIRQMDESMQKMKRSSMDLMQIHNLVDWKTHLETLKTWKTAGKIRYIGITHYTDSMHNELIEIISKFPIDFVQFNYSILSRNAEEKLLPVAQDKGVATIINQPFAEGRLFSLVKGKPLPDWAKENEINSWAQFFLKFILSNPAVTCVIPGTSNPRHAADNMLAGYGRLPDAVLRQKMASLIESM
jgi:diketogulonate reductase-like aldo/keto reductase/DNA-binding response OmpR family regulator/nitrogen-specific signal transduction histidine kinase